MKFLTLAVGAFALIPAVAGLAMPQEDDAPEAPAAPAKPAGGAPKGAGGGAAPKAGGGGGAAPKAPAGGGRGGGGSTSSELTGGSCKPVILIFARASTEPGNMGGSMGPMTCSGLKREYPDKVICQGVGQPYSAGLADNVAPAGTTAAAIGEATKMFNMANTKCASSVIVFGGYSQGTAVMMNAVGKLPKNVQSKVVGGVLFGYTKNGQTKGTIPGYPAENVKVFCNPSPSNPAKFQDGVCGGGLNVNGGHFAYMGNGDGPKAVAFLKSKIDPALRKGGA